MRAISVRQPWSWAIMHAGKTVENRSRNIAGTYRGPVAIHAGLQLDPIGKNSEIIHTAARRAVTTPGDHPIVHRYNGKTWIHEPSLPRGVFLGVVDLIDAHPAVPARVDFDGLLHEPCCDSEWAEFAWYSAKPLVHLVLANPRLLPEPIMCSGRLGLWTPPASMLTDLQAVTS